jgi:acid phosphatase
MGQAYKSIAADSVVQERRIQQWNQIKHIAEFIGLDYSESALGLLADWVGTYNCVERSLPAFVSQTDIANCHALVADLMYAGSNRNATVLVSYAMREALRIAELAVKEGKIKFSLLSSHDSTVASFVCYLAEFDQSRIPPYASHVLMEIWVDRKSERYVRWSFNGNVLKLKKFENKELVGYEEFLEKTRDVYNYCKELP